MRNRLFKPRSRVILALIFALTMMVGLAAPSFTPVAAAVQGDGMMVYGEGTVTTPRTRNWTQASTTWSAEASGPTAAASIRHIVVESSPIRDEVIVGIQTTSGVLYLQRWNGTSWSSEWNVTVGNGNLQRFDIAYERNSGEALVVYSGNVATTNELRYRVWNGSTWTVATNLDAGRTAGVVHAIKLSSHAGTLNNDIGLAWGDANLDLSANYWSGSTNTWGAEPAAALSTGLAVVSTATALTNFCFDVALESSSGDMLIVWGSNAVQDLLYITRGVGSGGSWGTATTQTSALEEPTDLELASDPNSDYIAYANISDNTTGADASTWTGTAWNSFSNFDTTTGTVASSTKSIAVSWLRSGSEDRAVVVYEDAATSTGIDWTFYNKNTNAWAVTQTDFTTAPAPASNVTFTGMNTNPFDRSQLMVTMVDSGSDVFAKRLTFNGTTFTWSSSEPGGAALETSGSSASGYAADYKYVQYIPGPLTVDIVDATDASVASPGVSMSVANVLLDCQTITGTFGTGSQKIRVNNATSTPGWTLTVAATMGSTAQWDSGTDQYDFNDGGGSPAGCADSGDADTQGGQFTVNPAAGSVAPKSGCTNTGVSLGAQSAFSQESLDSLTLATASTSATTSCYWDVSGIAVSQKIPADKPAGNYSINLTLTATSN